MTLRWITFAALSALAVTSAQAGTLKVSPIKVFMGADGGARTIKLNNPDIDASLVKVEAIDWAEDDLDSAERSKEIIAVPPVFMIDGGAEQTIRLALKSGAPNEKERAYRLLITEVPQEVGEAGGLTFAVRLNLPLFVTPPGAKPEPIWTVERNARGITELVLRNQGRAHLLVERLELKAETSTRPVFETEAPVYALAGEAKRWRLNTRLDSLPEPLEVHATTHLGTQTSPVIRR